ncbi:hypothetical protein VVMO6_04534 [Vibrio vulnificus MO6-24/O]|nr:hypothetical protein VVMO6_04534 [Vibrio vulnificus MO6-24/O]
MTPYSLVKHVTANFFPLQKRVFESKLTLVMRYFVPFI